ncbi:protein lethal(2)essential for life-like [Argiope bruennichi]|uniref:protein lethal(2)essential for life-like n=1 Tax=Argiope bruennichi TaxID=94029 RepID=UPI0024942218|nr:protein lethal(2)essential for life-like [Argiope bruennichi]
MSGGSSDPGFETKINISDFSPDEVTVHADDRYVTITGEHEERMGESGYVGRHFIRRFMLPEDVSTEHLSTQLSDDGILTIQAPSKTAVAGKSSPEAVQGSSEPSSPTREVDQEQVDQKVPIKRTTYETQKS